MGDCGDSRSAEVGASGTLRVWVREGAKDRFFNACTDITKVMQRKNFWYPLMWSLHEYRAEEGKTTVKGTCVSIQALNRVFAVGLLLIGGWIATSAPLAWGQEVDRKTKTKVAPVYPALARRMNITGVVKVQITVAATGSVKNAKLVGGHPVLANAALDAVKKWRFETGPQESMGIVEFHFDPTQSEGGR